MYVIKSIKNLDFLYYLYIHSFVISFILLFIHTMEILWWMFWGKKWRKVNKVTSKVEEEAVSVLKDKDIIEDDIDMDDTINDVVRDSRSNEIDDDDREDENDRYHKLKNFEASLLNMVIKDPVLRYALENGKWKFLREMKDWTKDGYKAMKKEMMENWWKNIEFKWSVLEKISQTYVYFVALEKMNTRILNWLVNKTALYNDWRDFARENWINIATGGMIFRDYLNWIESKNLK